MTRSTTPMREREREQARERERGRDKEKGKKRDKKEDIGPPGAGTLFVYGVEDGVVRPRSRSGGGRRSKERLPANTVGEVLTWGQCAKIRHDLYRSRSPDALLERGIEAYNFIPSSDGGVLGRGKFSTVYKVTDHEGRHYALKHTALHPHHPLIAARLLREPTLLAQVPIHPCLVGVHGSIRTSGHFYLIEQYASSHIPLSSHPTRLLPSRAAYILDQLVSVTRDCLHSGGRVVHRDLKGENILIDERTGELLLLDLGLATHYSASEPKLTTCCGSPAFHSPEIVTALNHAPGEISYYGPELDIWCIALTLLSLLLDVRYPIGPSHKSIHVMRDRVLDRLQEIDELYPPSAPCKYVAPELSDDDKALEVIEWRKVRKALRDFLEIDGWKRMRHFEAYDLGEKIRGRVDMHSQEGEEGFKTLSFLPTDVKYTLPLYLDGGDREAGEGRGLGPIVLSNPGGVSERKVLSYIKYILRSRGVLYHCLSVPPLNTSDTEATHVPAEVGTEPAADRAAMIQLVLPCPAPTSDYLADVPSPKSKIRNEEEKKESWVSSLFSGPAKRATSVPAQHDRQARKSSSKSPSSRLRTPVPKTQEGEEWFLKCWARIEVEKPTRPSPSRMSSRRGSVDTTACASPCPSSTSTAATSPGLPTSPLLAHGLPMNPILGSVTPLTTLQEGVAVKRAGPVRAHSVDGQQRMPSGSNSVGWAGAGAAAAPGVMTRTASTSRIPRRPHPLSRQVSLETRKSSTASTASVSVSVHAGSANHAYSTGGAVPKVTISLSDPRGYGVLRAILDVKHLDGAWSSPLSSTGTSTTVAVPEPIAGAKGARSGSDDEEEEERGRPRSKEDSKVIVVLERGAAEVAMPKPTHPHGHGHSNRSGSGRENGRPHSRGRKIGFLEGWFGIGGGGSGGGGGAESPSKSGSGRSASSPPSSVSPVEMGPTRESRQVLFSNRGSPRLLY